MLKFKIMWAVHIVRTIKVLKQIITLLRWVEIGFDCQSYILELKNCFLFVFIVLTKKRLNIYNWFIK